MTDFSPPHRSAEKPAAPGSAAIPPGIGPLPQVLAGPILRRVERGRLVFWLVGSRSLALRLQLSFPEKNPESEDSLDRIAVPLDGPHCRRIPIGAQAVVHLVDTRLEELGLDPLPQDRLVAYDLRVTPLNAEDLEEEDEEGIADYAPHLLYEGEREARFVVKSRLDSLLHGSCRKPHHFSKDGLAAADRWLEDHRSQASERPAALLLTGDQIYADDVSGPMLSAIHALIERLGLFDETLEGAVVKDSQALYQARDCYYRRDKLLPAMETTETLRERFFGGAEKPVFTTANADNHLITLAEVLAMYLLVWSPTPWRLIAPQRPELPEEEAERYSREAEVIEDFVAQLPQAARLMAQIPTLMIFDDHDVTDDWNLTADWEANVYGNPFSNRIVGNALVAYLLCQGWGNAPNRVKTATEVLAELMEATARSGWLDSERHKGLIESLRRLECWDYCLDTAPKLVVLDTRTRRWRNENNLKRPSGLMDWEALCEFQQELLDNDSIVVVSPAPMFGVKLIETIQRIFTWAGHPLMVDAENWMAHRGAARTMLNIFRHSRTPGRYVILSGDVHYSFVYDIRIRHRDAGPEIWQITSSGVKNEFPPRLLDWFDRLNRWLYAPWSPLNWLTKRRAMEVSPRVPDRAKTGERLWNGAGIGYVRLDETGRPATIRQLGANGIDTAFPPRPGVREELKPSKG